MINQTPRIEWGITKLIVPYEKGELVTAWPSKGPNTYKNVGKEILGDTNDLRLQTGYETAVLAKTAYDSKEPEFVDVKDKICNRFLWVYQTNFWLPENDKNSGMYSVHDSNALGTGMEFNQEELEEKLKGAETYQGVKFNPDAGIAFAPRSTIYLGKETDWTKFARNGLNIAIFSPQGAQVLSELGKAHFKYGLSWGISGNNQVEKRVSALDRDAGFVDKLLVDGYDRGDDHVSNNHGHSFGVPKEQSNK